MSKYDAERTDIKRRYYKYRTDVYFYVSEQAVSVLINSFEHRTSIGGYIRTAITVWRHKRSKNYGR